MHAESRWNVCECEHELFNKALNIPISKQTTASLSIILTWIKSVFSYTSVIINRFATTSVRLSFELVLCMVSGVHSGVDSQRILLRRHTYTHTCSIYENRTQLTKSNKKQQQRKNHQHRCWPYSGDTTMTVCVRDFNFSSISFSSKILLWIICLCGATVRQCCSLFLSFSLSLFLVAHLDVLAIQLNGNVCFSICVYFVIPSNFYLLIFFLCVCVSIFECIELLRWKYAYARRCSREQHLSISFIYHIDNQYLSLSPLFSS